jgi:hypothetical protein
MGVGLRSWWQQIKQHRVTILVVAIILIIAIALIIVGYNIDGAGFNGYSITTISKTISRTTPPTNTTTTVYQPSKTLWDWLQLLIIPFALAIIAILFNRAERKNEQRIATDNQRETALQAYIDKIAELLLREHLDESPSGTQVQVIARARTATVLRILEPVLRGSLIRFLSQAGILVKCTEKAMAGLDLHGADLSRLNLSSTNLSTANLSEAFLSESDLSEAFLIQTKLCEASLWGANFSRADLTGADLSEALLIGANLYSANLTNANLNGANLNGAYNTSKEQLEQAKSLNGATMPDGSIHL